MTRSSRYDTLYDELLRWCLTITKALTGTDAPAKTLGQESCLESCYLSRRFDCVMLIGSVIDLIARHGSRSQASQAGPSALQV